MVETSRTLEQALAHAEEIRSGLAAGGPVVVNMPLLEEFVLLADEVKRLRLCSQCGCNHATAYELGRSDERHAQKDRDDRTLREYL